MSKDFLSKQQASTKLAKGTVSSGPNDFSTKEFISGLGADANNLASYGNKQFVIDDHIVSGVRPSPAVVATLAEGTYNGDKNVTFEPFYIDDGISVVCSFKINSIRWDRGEVFGIYFRDPGETSVYNPLFRIVSYQELSTGERSIGVWIRTKEYLDGVYCRANEKLDLGMTYTIRAMSNPNTGQFIVQMYHQTMGTLPFTCDNGRHTAPLYAEPGSLISILIAAGHAQWANGDCNVTFTTPLNVIGVPFIPLT